VEHDVVGGVRRNGRVCLDVWGQMGLPTQAKKQGDRAKIYQSSALPAIVAMVGKNDGMRLVNGSVPFGPTRIHTKTNLCLMRLRLTAR